MVSVRVPGWSLAVGWRVITRPKPPDPEQTRVSRGFSSGGRVLKKPPDHPAETRMIRGRVPGGFPSPTG